MKRLIVAFIIIFLLVLYFISKAIYLLVTRRDHHAVNGAGLAISFFIITAFILLADIVKDFLQKIRGL